jgi:hypothetical protein
LIFTVVLPSVVSDAIEVTGYGMGTGPAGGEGGLLQVSGNAAMTFPLLALQETSLLFANTLPLMQSSEDRG